LEERGIGRPSTYAPTLATIQERGYVELDGKWLRPTALGRQVNDFLVQHFGDVVDPTFTAELEARLDQIARGERRWVPVVSAYYQPLVAHLREVTASSGTSTTGEPSGEHCSQGHAMVIKDGRTGRFLACSQYPAHQETRALLRPVGVPCPVCGGDVVEKHTRSGATFFGCVAWPKCHWSSSYPPLSEACPYCGGLQVDLGAGSRHCLKHQGQPPRPAMSPGQTPTMPGGVASRAEVARPRATAGRQVTAERAADRPTRAGGTSRRRRASRKSRT
ncbi:MAG TPA: DNA topoisomerase, partial [Chloroflexota bacterium]|nr:DNA topoisomerase [Chloroflexota bacterium]